MDESSKKKQIQQANNKIIMEHTYITKSSEMCELMVYFAHTTLCIYAETIMINTSMSVNDFRNKNEEVIKRVFDESLSMFNYVLSYEEMSGAIALYFQTKFRPLSVKITKVKNLK